MSKSTINKNEIMYAKILKGNKNELGDIVEWVRSNYNGGRRKQDTPFEEYIIIKFLFNVFILLTNNNLIERSMYPDIISDAYVYILEYFKFEAVTITSKDLKDKAKEFITNKFEEIAAEKEHISNVSLDNVIVQDMLSKEEYINTVKETIEIGILGNLMDREMQIISLRFGLDGSDGLSLQKCANIIKRSRERVRQIEAVSLRKLKRFYDEKRLLDFYYCLEYDNDSIYIEKFNNTSSSHSCNISDSYIRNGMWKHTLSGNICINPEYLVCREIKKTGKYKNRKDWVRDSLKKKEEIKKAKEYEELKKKEEERNRYKEKYYYKVFKFLSPLRTFVSNEDNKKQKERFEYIYDLTCEKFYDLPTSIAKNPYIDDYDLGFVTLLYCTPRFLSTTIKTHPLFNRTEIGELYDIIFDKCGLDKSKTKKSLDFIAVRYINEFNKLRWLAEDYYKILTRGKFGKLGWRDVFTFDRYEYMNFFFNTFYSTMLELYDRISSVYNIHMNMSLDCNSRLYHNFPYTEVIDIYNDYCDIVGGEEYKMILKFSYTSDVRTVLMYNNIDDIGQIMSIFINNNGDLCKGIIGLTKEGELEILKQLKANNII